MKHAQGLFTYLKLIIPGALSETANGKEEVEAATDILIDAVVTIRRRGGDLVLQHWHTRKGVRLPSTPKELLLAMLNHGNQGFAGDQDFFFETVDQDFPQRICLDLSEYFRRVIGEACYQILRGDKITNGYLNIAKNHIKARLGEQK